MDTYKRMRFNDALMYYAELRQLSVPQLQQLLNDPQVLHAELDKLQQFVCANRESRIESWFSNLHEGEYKITSNIDFGYNCIAWSAEEMSEFWWPVGHYWPPGILPQQESVEAFNALYTSLGYFACKNGAFEIGYEKIALYAKNGRPTHAARMLSDGRWTSKMGRWEDLTHSLHALTGNGPNEYGDVVRFFRRRNPKFRHPAVIFWRFLLAPFRYFIRVAKYYKNSGARSSRIYSAGSRCRFNSKSLARISSSERSGLQP